MLFSIRLQGTTAEVREGGVYKSETSFATGDVIRITVGGGVVTYSRNGNVFFTSSGSAFSACSWMSRSTISSDDRERHDRYSFPRVPNALLGCAAGGAGASGACSHVACWRPAVNRMKPTIVAQFSRQIA